MKFGILRSIGHNIADSLAGGMGFLIGVYQTDVYGEAAQSPEGYILVDFLTGTSSGGQVSESLARAISLYGEALQLFCRRHGAHASAFRELTARYSVGKDVLGREASRFVVTVVDQNGRRSVDTYVGAPGKRMMVLDEQGRIRRIRSTESYDTEH